SQTFFGANFLGAYYPNFELGSKFFGNFKDLLWDPYNLLGRPLLGGVDRLGMFYPLKFLAYAFNHYLSTDLHIYVWTYFNLFHLSLAGICMFLFARKVLNLSSFSAFISGIVYMFSGILILFSIHPNHL